MQTGSAKSCLVPKSEFNLFLNSMMSQCRQNYKLFGTIILVSLCVAPFIWFIDISFDIYSPAFMSFNRLQHDTNNNLLQIPDMQSRPHLSFIITSRNDEYGENPILRLRFTLQNLMLYEWSSHNISIEIIIIEWNTVETKPHLWQYPLIQQLIKMYKDKFKINDKNSKRMIYFYSIPSHYNDRIECSFIERPHQNDYCPFFEYHAKNVGLRRSNGIWKIVMNIDDLWSHNLLNFVAYSLSNNLLDKNGIYQAMRKFNIIHLNKPLDNHMMDYLNISEVIPTRYPNFYKKAKNYTKMYQKCLFPHKKLNKTVGRGGVVQGPGDFTLFHGDILYKYFIGGFVESCHNVHLDTEFVMRQININKLNAYYITANCSYFHIQHSKQRFINKTEIIKYKEKELYREKKFNCNQSGKKIRELWPDSIDVDKKLPLNEYDLFWHRIYMNTNSNWGLKDEELCMNIAY